MKKYYLQKPIPALLLCFAFVTSCQGQSLSLLLKDSTTESKNISVEHIKIYGPASDPFLEGQISPYVRRIFQDTEGHFWFGTNGDGVCRYDGQSLTYFTPSEGFGGYAVRGILEDEHGNLWFATDGGVSRYDRSRANHPCLRNTCRHHAKIEGDQQEHDAELAKSFTNYTVKDGLSSDGIWCILQDRTGNFWFGTEGGVCRYDGTTFTSFPIPAADLTDFPGAYLAPKLVNCIFQDKTGALWFGTNGNGVYRYDGTSLTNISEQDGLCNNFVQCILEDTKGNFWFGTRFGGLSRFDGKTFTHFTEMSNIFFWTILEDKAGNLWFGTAGGGAYRYDGKSFTNFTFTAYGGKVHKHVQSIWEDKKGKLWFGFSGGLFRFEKESFVNVRKIGPW